LWIDRILYTTNSIQKGKIIFHFLLRPTGHAGYMKKIYLTVILVCTLGIGSVFSPYAYGKDPPSREKRIKAAFLYNFAKFVKWPEQAFDTPESPIVFCVIGKDPFDGALAVIAKKKIRNRPLVVEQRTSLSPENSFHVLFIAQSEKNKISRIIGELKAIPVLTISDADGFIENNGIIEMIKAKNKIRFQINLGAARDSGLTISSQLLKLATRVIE